MAARTVQFGSFDFDRDDGIYIESIKELSGPQRVLTILDKAGTAGQSFLRSVARSKVIKVTGHVARDTETDFSNTIRDMTQALIAEHLNQPTPVSDLTIGVSTGTFVYDDCVLLNAEDLFQDDQPYYGGRLTHFEALFLCPKGTARNVNVTQVLVENIDEAPYEGTLTVGGTAAPEPVLQFTFVDPSTIEELAFSNLTTNETITIPNLTLVASDILTINTMTKEVRLNDALIDFEGIFPTFLPGANDYQIALSGDENIAIQQTDYDATEAVYGARQVFQKITADFTGDVSQLAFFLKKVTTPQGANMDVLVVGGGGSGGGANNAGRQSGGGGGGGVVYKTGHFVQEGAYSITVGGGVAGNAENQGNVGQDSVFDTLTGKGGGAGGHKFGNGGAGGSGGGGGGSDEGGGGAGSAIQPSQSGDSGTYGFGNNGGTGNQSGSESNRSGGGGGGAGGAGTNGSGGGGGGNGGAGKDVSATFGTSVGASGLFGGGGAGTGGSGNGSAGSGGGGSAGGGAGGANTGGGGGGRGGNSGNNVGGSGGSGVVIVRYLTAAFASVSGGDIVTVDGSYTQRVFTQSGTLTVVAHEILGDLVVEIQSDDAGDPSGTPITDGSLTIDKDDVGTSSFSEILSAFLAGSLPAITDTTVYHIVLRQAAAAGDASNYYEVRKNTAGGLAGGNSGNSTDGGTTWNHNAGHDLYFKLWSTLPSGMDIDFLASYYATYYAAL